MRSAGCIASLAILLLAVLVRPGRAQYLFLDADADSVSSEGDRLDSLGTATSVDVWIVTDRNRDGTLATCVSGPDSLTINSYELILQAAGGAVTYGPVTNHMSTMTTQFGYAHDSTAFYVGFGGGTSLSPGKYKLCTLEITARSGNPNIEPAASTLLNAAYRTSFGSRCSGVDQDNTLKLGTDWSDADGLASRGNLSLSVSAPPDASIQVGVPVSIEATVNGAGGLSGVTLEVMSIPQGASATFGEGNRSATVRWLPLNGDVGTHSITFRAAVGSDSTEETATINIAATNSSHTIYVSDGIRALATAGPNSRSPRVVFEDGEERVSVFLESDATNASLAGRGVFVSSRHGRSMVASCIRDSLANIGSPAIDQRTIRLAVWRRRDHLHRQGIVAVEPCINLQRVYGTLPARGVIGNLKEDIAFVLVKRVDSAVDRFLRIVSR